MKKHLEILSFLLISLLLLSSSTFAGQFKVIKVYDGDTIKAEGYDIVFQVRLVGIDAPETSKKKTPGYPDTSCLEDRLVY
jgi:endonuclease YncB( thermonuclease family)